MPGHADDESLTRARLTGERGDDTAIITTGDVAQKRASPDRGTLTMLAGPTPGAVFAMDDDVVIGRGRDATLRVDDRGLSRRHVRIRRQEERFWIEDLGSTNGTFLNGDRVLMPSPLSDGDRVQAGKNTLLCFQLQDELEQRAAQRLYDSAVRDALTQLHNRRYLDERLESELAYAMRHSSALSVMLVDLDHFKGINDTFGHPAGDTVLRTVAATLGRVVRAEDLVARYGGEEFCVLARGINVGGGTRFAERIRETLAELSIAVGDRTLHVTASLGVATFDTTHPFPDVAALVHAADLALYRAKETGRNRVVHAEQLRQARGPR
ncbi:MAG: GGDEF domain-containing protein [Myxococcota bacterium]